MEVGQHGENTMKIINRLVGLDHLPLVIAELGINHGGSLKVAFEMVDAAHKAGAEIIKHQTHIINDEMSSEARNIVPGNAKIPIYDIMENCSLNQNEEQKLMEYVISKNMIFISTPFSRAAADRLENMNVPAYKIGSGECNNYPLIKHIASFKKPIIMSTGMNSISGIKKAVRILETASVDYALLHTTNIYPTPPELVRLGSIVQLKKEFPNAIVGLSDHTTTNHACFGAIALGASILERHFTDSMLRTGPDISCSMDPKSLEELLHGVKILFKERGGAKGALEEEKVTSNFAFASVVSIKKIKKGQKLTKENIWVKRPGNGDFLAEDYENLLGKIAVKEIETNTQIKKSQVV